MRIVVLLLFSLPAFAQWSQWGGNHRHTGSLPVDGQRLFSRLAEEVVDPFAPVERAEATGALLVHYQTPLSDGNELFMEVKGGAYTGFRTWATQTWSIRKFAWENGVLVTKWTTASDWDPVPWAQGGGPRFEPVFHAAITATHVYMPAAGGTVQEVDRNTGAITRRLGAFGGLDPNVYVTSPITIDAAGNLYYNTLRVDPAAPWSSDHLGAWLVKVAQSGTASRVSYATLVPDAPATCTTIFSGTPQPFPPAPDAVAPSAPCGSQRAGINLAPAVAPDGTIYTASRAHFNERWGFFVAVNGDMTLKWVTSMRNRFNDGCGVLVPIGGPGGCREGTTIGVDPFDNQRGSGGVNDNATSSPVVAPDGTIYYGAFTRYNHAQGHTIRFSPAGEVLQSYKFGWDVTPAIWEHDSTFSIITKENRYPGLPERMPGDEQGFYITQLRPNLTVDWQFKATNTQSCSRRPDGSLDCIDDRPEGFEWCVNALAVDRRGIVYVNSEDGNLYAINQGGTLRERIFLQLASGAAYTPLSLGVDGKIYTQNAGILFVVGTNTTGGKRRSVRK